MSSFKFSGLVRYIVYLIPGLKVFFIKYFFIIYNIYDSRYSTILLCLSFYF